MSSYFDPCSYPYPSRREIVYGRNGMVCTSQSLAAQAGLDMLKKGGNAVDSALATAIALTVLEPTSNGLGSDLFALIWTDGRLYGLNGSGHSPAKMTPHILAEQGYTEMPLYGWLPVMVPGAPAAWYVLHERFGRLPFAELFGPAVTYARNGYALMPTVGTLMKSEYEKYASFNDNPAFAGLFKTFYTNGIPPVGSLLTLPDHAKSLQSLAETNCTSLYTGELADAIDAFSQKTGGLLCKDDLAAYKPLWIEPLYTTYKGYDVWELPPNGQGVVVLMALNILNGMDFKNRDDTVSVHTQIEALKLALTDGKKYIADARFMKTPPAYLLSEEYAATRRAQISAEALLPEPIDPGSGGTVYLCSADHEGNMVSLIQSNYDGFGSGIVIPGYGIALNNRGHNFSNDPYSDNAIGPRKRSYHTIIPGFLSKDGAPIGPFGVMGAFMQPQGQLQILTNMIDSHLNPQAALDAPRWQWKGGKYIEVETNFPVKLREALRQKGHDITINPEVAPYGRGQIIWRTEDETLMGATDPRADGTVAAW